jgi:hypothetical protein
LRLARFQSGQTPLHIAEKLGYITVIDTLKVVTQATSPTTTSPISNEEKYRVVAPEAMHETFMSDSEEEGGECRNFLLDGKELRCVRCLLSHHLSKAGGDDSIKKKYELKWLNQICSRSKKKQRDSNSR